MADKRVVRTVTLAVGLLELASALMVARLLPGVSVRSYGVLAMIGTGIWAWRHFAPDDQPDYLAQLDRWCERLGIDTPEVLRHSYTSTGETYVLRVTGLDEDGLTMTPETFRGLWPRFRAVAGNECRRVDINIDGRHGGRVRMDIRWTDSTPTAIVAEVEMTPTHMRYCRNEDDVRAAVQEAIDAGHQPTVTRWPAPTVAKLQGEG